MEEFNNWDAIAARFDKALSQVVRKTAHDIQARAQVNAPVDTGFLKNSIYTVTFNSRGTKTLTDKVTGKKTKISKPISSSRRRVRKSMQDQVFPELNVSLDDWTAYVTVGAVYGIYVEMGTVYMPAQPYFYPAIDEVESDFEEALSRIEEKLGQDIDGSIEDESI